MRYKKGDKVVYFGPNKKYYGQILTILKLNTYDMDGYYFKEVYFWTKTKNIKPISHQLMMFEL